MSTHQQFDPRQIAVFTRRLFAELLFTHYFTTPFLATNGQKIAPTIGVVPPEGLSIHTFFVSKLGQRLFEEFLNVRAEHKEEQKIDPDVITTDGSNLLIRDRIVATTLTLTEAMRPRIPHLSFHQPPPIILIQEEDYAVLRQFAQIGAYMLAQEPLTETYSGEIDISRD